MNERDVPPERIGAGELFRAHARFVTGLLVRMGAPPTDLPDLVQDVFLTAHRRGGFVPGAAQPTTWLAQIAINILRNARRSRQRRPISPGDPELAISPAADPARQAETSEALRGVAACLETLAEGDREAFVLFELEGLGAAEVAAALEVPVGTVYSRLHRARQRFLSAWKERAQ
jgi:RNA polymerase sigma-70 factor, ECF subfamily